MSMDEEVRNAGTRTQPARRKGAGRLLRLAVSCPSCGAPPALRVDEDEVAKHQGDPPGKRVGTYQCRRRQCEAIYDITAAAYQQAS